MKILYINKHMHVKNNNAMTNYKNIQLHIIENTDLINNIDFNNYDCIYSPWFPIEVSKYPKIKFIFGPHFSIFPERNHMDIISEKNVIYIQPSNWARDEWKNNSLCKNLRIESLPFGVDTIKFNEIIPYENRTKVFVYYKRRHPEELTQLMEFLKINNINVDIFSYTTKYNESDYIDCLQNSKFGIWLGSHESQGFALQEALACNVPLLVWNVKSMNQEYNSNFSNISATSIPYWDKRCGESFEDISQMSEKFTIFINNLNLYKPREFILENLTMEICEKKLMELIKNF